MAAVKKQVGDLIVRQALDSQDIISKNPMVLSCGGIYIPRRPEHEKILYQIINTSSKIEPVKVVTGARPRNALHEVLLRESMN